VTAVTVTRVQQRPWRGYDDPGLPVGMYISQGVILGDLSGGDMQINIRFRNAGVAASGRFFNIEQLEISVTSELSATPGFLNFVNFELSGTTGLVNRAHRFILTSTAGAISALDFSEAPRLPIFLGITSPIPALDADVIIGIDNIDGETLTATMQGYIWEPRSVMALGGLRRPVDSLYGR